MTEFYEKLLNKRFNLLSKNKITKLNDVREVIGFFKALKLKPEKRPKWIKEMIGDKEDITPYIVHIYNAIKDSNLSLKYDLYYGKLKEDDIITYIVKLFCENNQ